MDLAVDLLGFAWDQSKWNILLIERKYPPFQGMWALPGGFVEEDEDLPNAAIRELKEETGVEVLEVFEIGAFGSPNRDPRKRVVSVAFASIFSKKEIPVAADDAQRAQWICLDNLPDLAFDHRLIIERALHRIHEYYLVHGSLPSEPVFEQSALEQLWSFETDN